jgi:hypothetical protein
LLTTSALRADLQREQPECSPRMASPAAEGVVAQRLAIANVLAPARGPGTSVFYSRDRSYYARMERLRRCTAGFTRQRRCGDSDLERAGLVEHRRTAPSASARYRLACAPARRC